MHGSANVIGGQNATVKLKWKRTADEMLIPDAPRTVKFALGENPKRSNSGGGGRGSTRRYPATRMGVEAVLREAFDGALDYRERWHAYDRAREAGQRVAPPRHDLRLEALAEILEGRIQVHCHCYRADEMLMLMQVADDYGFRISVLQHALEAYRIAPEIARHGAAVSTFADWWAYKFEAYDATPYNAAICAREGVVTSINSDSEDHIRRLNGEAAKAVKYGGLAPAEALKLVTLNPARQLGIEHRTGSLAEGKDGDIVLWNGDPLGMLSRPMYVLIEGEVHFDRQREMAGRTPTRRTLLEDDR
jgi:imidazolonepropionase-like amidohydrolase